jgi:hypothetical protein
MTPLPPSQQIPAIHELLLEVLASAQDRDLDASYGVALFQRPGPHGMPVFGIVTSSGESTVLTHRMLRALREQRVFISGRVGACIQEGLPGSSPRAVPALLLDEPAVRITVTCVIGSSPDDVDRTASLSTSFVASELHAPLIVACLDRPDGWPA